MKYLKQIKQRFNDTYPAFLKRQQNLANEALDGLQEDADSFGLPIDIDSSLLDGLFSLFAVAALVCVILLNLGLSWSKPQSEVIWFFMIGCGVLAVALYLLTKFAIGREGDDEQ